MCKRILRIIPIFLSVMLLIGTAVTFAADLRWIHMMSYSGTVGSSSMTTGTFKEANGFVINHSQWVYSGAGTDSLRMDLCKLSGVSYKPIESKYLRGKVSQIVTFTQAQTSGSFCLQLVVPSGSTKYSVSGSAMK